MTLRELQKKVGKSDSVCIKDYANNIIIEDTKFELIPKEYLDVPVVKYNVYETQFCGKEQPKGYEVFLATIDSDTINAIKVISEKFKMFLNSFDDYRPIDVAIICKTLLEEHTKDFEGKKLIGTSLHLYCELPKRDSVEFSSRKEN